MIRYGKRRRDLGHEETDKIIAELERRIRKTYKRASEDVEKKLKDYLEAFERKDRRKRDQMERGVITEDEYIKWRQHQIMMGKRWAELKNHLAADMHNANVNARQIVNGERANIYATNVNYATYMIEDAARIDTGYTLYDKDTVNRIIAEEPELLPPPGPTMEERIAAGKDIRWQKGQIQSVMTQALVQGESVPNIAKRIADEIGETNHKSTIRYARTAATGAQNAGREDAYRRAISRGIDMAQTWAATLDSRTRHEHRMLDGQTVEVGEPFKVDGYKIMFPGDPTAPGHLVWNCRCTTVPQIRGFEEDITDIRLRNTSRMEEATYEEWKKARKSESHPITKQEEIAKIMRGRYAALYRR